MVGADSTVELRNSTNGVTFYFIDNQYYFFRGHVYGDFDDGERFAFFQLAAIEAMEGLTLFLIFSMFMTTIQL